VAERSVYIIFRYQIIVGLSPVFFLQELPCNIVCRLAVISTYCRCATKQFGNCLRLRPTTLLLRPSEAAPLAAPLGHEAAPLGPGADPSLEDFSLVILLLYYYIVVGCDSSKESAMYQDGQRNWLSRPCLLPNDIVTWSMLGRISQWPQGCTWSRSTVVDQISTTNVNISIDELTAVTYDSLPPDGRSEFANATMRILVITCTTLHT
jgi:hypothetical protein